MYDFAATKWYKTSTKIIVIIITRRQTKGKETSTPH